MGNSRVVRVGLNCHNCGSGEATDEVVIFSFAGAADSSMEFFMLGVLLRGGLCSANNCSTYTTSESVELKEFLLIFFEENGSCLMLTDVKSTIRTIDGGTTGVVSKIHQARKPLMFPQ